MLPLPSGIRRASRRLARSPGFTIAAVAMLAVGLGATTTMFGIVRGVLLRPLPYEEPDRLFRAYFASPERGVMQSSLSLPDLEDLRDQSVGVSHLAGYFSFGRNLTRETDPAVLHATYVTSAFFPALGSLPQLGRALAAADFDEGRSAAVLSHRAWERHFGRDPGVVGSRVRIDGAPHTVVGVMPRDFRFPDPSTDIWLPLSLLVDASLVPTNRSARWLAAVGRVAPGYTPDRARAELSTVAGRLARDHPASNDGWNRVTVVELRESIVGDVRLALLLALSAVGLVLVLVCVNVAGLLLVRSTSRHHDAVVRAALGAGRARLASDTIAEGLLLALLGGAGGVLLAMLAIRGMQVVDNPLLPRSEAVEIDGAVLGFAFGVTLLATVLSSTMPALRAARPDLSAVLRGGSGSKGSRGGERLRAVLVATQIAVAVVLSIGAALMLRSLHEIRQIDPGFAAERVLTARIRVPIPADRRDLSAQIVSRTEQILEELRALPGVESAGSINTLPLEPAGAPLPLSAGAEVAPGEAPLLAQPRSVAGDYFRVMGIPLLDGRTFPASVAEGSPTRAVISESTARRLWPGQEPVGRSLWMGIPYRVIGVVGDVSGEGLTEELPLTVYRDLRQQPLADVAFVLRTRGDPADLAGAVRAAIRRVDPAQPVTDVVPLDQVISASLGEDVLFAGLLGAFGLMAAILAMLGLYATLSHAVRQRTGEIGIRIALGARGRDVIAMVIRRGAALAAIGVLGGLIAASVTSRVLSALLHDVGTLDPLAFIGIGVLLMATAVGAAYVPARRASRADPVAALRSEGL